MKIVNDIVQELQELSFGIRLITKSPSLLLYPAIPITLYTTTNTMLIGSVISLLLTSWSGIALVYHLHYLLQREHPSVFSMIGKSMLKTRLALLWGLLFTAGFMGLTYVTGFFVTARHVPSCITCLAIAQLFTAPIVPMIAYQEKNIFIVLKESSLLLWTYFANFLIAYTPLLLVVLGAQALSIRASVLSRFVLPVAMVFTTTVALVIATLVYRRHQRKQLQEMVVDWRMMWFE